MSPLQPRNLGFQISRRLSVLGLPLLLAACAAAGNFAPSAPTAAYLTPSQQIMLPHPVKLGRKTEARQLVTVTGGGKSLAFEARISATPERFSMVGVDTLGRRAITMSWDGRALAIELAPWVPEGLPASSLMADIAMIYWPETAVRAQLKLVGGDVVQQGRKRTIQLNGSDVISAEHDWAAGGAWNGLLRYKNLAWGTEVEVQSQELK